MPPLLWPYFSLSTVLVVLDLIVDHDAIDLLQMVDFVDLGPSFL